MRIVILDCDIASCLAKVDRVDLLKKAFLDSDIYITNSIYIELLRAKQAGFSFPDEIFESIPVMSLNQDEREKLSGIIPKEMDTLWRIWNNEDYINSRGLKEAFEDSHRL